MPKWVVSASYVKKIILSPVQFSTLFMGTFPKSTIGSQYLTFTKVKPNTQHAAPPMAFPRWMSRVRVDRLSHENAWIQFTLFFGKLNQLFFDPTRWWWPKVTPFLAYLAKLNRKWVTSQEALKKSIPKKWWNEISPSTSSSWKFIWHKYKAH